MDVLQQDRVGEADALVLRPDGDVQLLHKGPVAALIDVAVGDEGIPLLPAGDAIDVGPDAVLPRRVVAVPLAVQQHQHGAVGLHLQQLLQIPDDFRRIPGHVKGTALQRVHRGRQVVPVGIQGVSQVDAHL